MPAGALAMYAPWENPAKSDKPTLVQTGHVSISERSRSDNSSRRSCLPRSDTFCELKCRAAFRRDRELHLSTPSHHALPGSPNPRTQTRPSLRS
jgi:hypothetical protein